MKFSRPAGGAASRCGWGHRGRAALRGLSAREVWAAASPESGSAGATEITFLTGSTTPTWPARRR